MKLTLVIEGAKGSEIIHKIIGWMRHCKLGEIVQQPEIQQLYAPLYERHVRSIDIIQKRAADRRRRRVLRSDRRRSGRLQQIHPVLFVPELHLHGLGEHVQFPDQGIGGIESVGARGAVKHNLATICERYGGGGHPRVGAISFEIGAVEKARAVAEEIRKELGT